MFSPRLLFDFNNIGTFNYLFAYYNLGIYFEPKPGGDIDLWDGRLSIGTKEPYLLLYTEPLCPKDCFDNNPPVNPNAVPNAFFFWEFS